LQSIAAALAVSCTGRRAGAVPTRDANTSAAIRSVIDDVLTNIRQNGHNPDPSINDGLGGLWINWRTGSNPLQTNLSSSGVAGTKNDDDGARHDELTDLRYLHNLWAYRSVYPDGLDVQGEIDRYTKIVAKGFASGRNERGWVYDLVNDLHRLSKEPFYEQLARRLATYYVNELFKPQLGSVCKIKKDRPRGSYRVDHAMCIGCALVQAGVTFGNDDWSQHGRQIIEFLYEQAYLPAYRTFPSELDHVLTEDGRPNQNARFFRPKGTEGGSAKPPALGQMALSLLHAHEATGEQQLLDRATDLLVPLTAADNSLGLWDAEYGGYFDKAVFSGTHVREPGAIRVDTGDKEGSRQLHLFEAFCVANRQTQGRFQEMEDRLLDITLHKAYCPEQHGFVYLMDADWSLLTLKDGSKRDWVTTEAMGIAVQALLTHERRSA
jgi:hypothetical protein